MTAFGVCMQMPESGKNSTASTANLQNSSINLRSGHAGAKVRQRQHTIHRECSNPEVSTSGLYMQVPESGKIYSFNEGNYEGWEQGLKDYMMSLKDADKHGGKAYSARYAPCVFPY